jgi:hypothetical protein
LVITDLESGEQVVSGISQSFTIQAAPQVRGLDIDYKNGLPLVQDYFLIAQKPSNIEEY